VTTTWYLNGQKESEVNFKVWGLEGSDGFTEYLDERDGLTITWYENGQKESKVNFKNDEQDGIASYWDENGQKNGD